MSIALDIAEAILAGLGVAYLLSFISCGIAIWCETHAGWMERFWEKRIGK